MAQDLKAWSPRCIYLQIQIFSLCLKSSILYIYSLFEMDPSAFTEDYSKEFYRFKNTACYTKVILSNAYEKRYIGICKESDFEKDGQPKHSNNTVLLPIVAAKQLLNFLQDAIDFAERITQTEGVHQFHRASFKLVD